MRIWVFFLLLVIPLFAWAQIPQNALVGYFPFDDCMEVDTSNVLLSQFDPGVQINIIRNGGDLNCEMDCGVVGSSFRFNGIDQQMIFFTGFSGVFDRRPFTISFYIRPEFSNSITNLFSKREDCSETAAFSIDYNPSNNNIDVLISEDIGMNANVSAPLDNRRCWQHIAYVRDGVKSQLYINGTLRDEAFSSANLDLSNSAALVFSSQLCSNRYTGLLDELAIYDGALSAFQIQDLYFEPDQLVNRDTAIFLGDFVPVDINNTCADNFQWVPDTGVDDPTDPQTNLRPTETTTYTLEFYDQGCTAEDQITITVFDPDSLDCTIIYFPEAFTPNEDNLNDVFRINNPRTFDSLISFDILDRWGARVFSTDDPFQGWDGTFDGQNVNPGVFLYRVRFMCNANEEVQSGSLTLLR